VAKKLERVHCENALLLIYNQAEVLRLLKYQAHVLLMGPEVRAGYTQVIQAAICEEKTGPSSSRNCYRHCAGRKAFF
jgi:hypothetical protein